MRARLWLIAAVLTGLLAAPTAQAQPGGSYRESCNNIRDSGGRDPEISANCKDMRGQWQFSSLRYGGCVGDIGNNNGQLVCNGGRPGSGPPAGGPGGGPGGPGWGGPGPGAPGPVGPGWGGAGLPDAANRACRQTFGSRAHLGHITLPRPGQWRVILYNDYGRRAACTVTGGGRILDWRELSRG